MSQDILQEDIESALLYIADKYPKKNFFLVAGNQSYLESGAKERVESILQNRISDFFIGVSPNPSLEEVRECLLHFQKSDASVILAIGGGSVIDVAKSVSYFAESDDVSTDSLIKNIESMSSGNKKTAPLVAIPTTAGTGTEATHFAVIYIDQKKYSLAHPEILPDVVVLDKKLVQSTTPYVTACTGFDALAQSVESLWSVNSTEESMAYAKDAIRIVVRNLTLAFEGDGVAKAEMLQAAHLSGKAINISKTTAAHAMSYPLTIKYGIPHGHAVMLTLPTLLEYNYEVSATDCNESRGVSFVKSTLNELFELFEVSSAEEASRYLKDLMTKCKVKTRLSDFGVAESAIFDIANELSAERAKNNPRIINPIVASRILKGAL